MKNKILLLTSIFVLSTSIAFTATLTLSNHPLGGAQYTNLVDAYNAASPGDTIIVEGTDIEYHIGTYWYKQLTVIGSGLNTNKQSFKRTIISFHYNRLHGAGSSFYGIEFPSVYMTQSNVLFEDCKFNGQVNLYNSTLSNISFRNCIFDSNNGININTGGSSNVLSGILVTNCVLDGYIEGNGNPYFSLMVNHCIFLDGSFNNVHNATITNNIFMNAFPGSTSTGSSTYLNNICRVAGTFPPTGYGGNVGSGNIDATDPLLVNVPISTFYSTDLDFHLQGGSPAIGVSTDATDIGVHGGNSNFSEQGEVLINPIIRQMLITNPSIAPNGTINVQISATKPDDN